MATTHWSGTWRKVDPNLGRLDELGFCIDAYHKTNKPHLGLLFSSGMDVTEGKHLRQWNKPILITEYGGSHIAAPPATISRASIRSVASHGQRLLGVAHVMVG